MGTAFGANTRYQAVTALLSELGCDYANHLRFGLQEMPGSGICGPQSNLAAVYLALDCDRTKHAQAMLATLGLRDTRRQLTHRARFECGPHVFRMASDDGVEMVTSCWPPDGAPDCT